jgi:hypothetical protein
MGCLWLGGRMISRQRIQTKYANGTVDDFNPIICWTIIEGMVEISIRGLYGIGFLWRWKIGTWSRYHTKFIEIGLLTIYIHYGRRAPYNPRTGKVW